MSFPNVDPLVDTLLDPTRILLFGKPFPNIQYNPVMMGEDGGAAAAGKLAEELDEAAVAATDPPQPPEFPPPGEFQRYDTPGEKAALPMPPTRVERTLRRIGAHGIFARIYSFSFEGHYYKMPRPLLFLVHGPGRSRVPEDLPPDNGGERQFNTRFVGIEAKDWHFGSDIQVWAVDKHDIAICLDIEIGVYDQVLLELDDRVPGRRGLARCGGVARCGGRPGCDGVARRCELPGRDGRAAPGSIGERRCSHARTAQVGQLPSAGAKSRRTCSRGSGPT